MNWLGKLIQDEITKEDTILDIGCGIFQAINGLECKSLLGIDIWIPYLDQAKNIHPVLMMSATELDRFRSKSFDVVLALDLVEHLEQSTAIKVIKETKRIARKKAIIFTPSVFESNSHNVENAWGLGYNPHQNHQCSISIDQFHQLDFRTTITQIDHNILAIWEKLVPQNLF